LYVCLPPCWEQMIDCHRSQMPSALSGFDIVMGSKWTERSRRWTDKRTELFAQMRLLTRVYDRGTVIFGVEI
jgi:hypothetical protein